VVKADLPLLKVKRFLILLVLIIIILDARYQFEKARHCFEKALEANPNNKYTLRNYAATFDMIESLSKTDKMNLYNVNVAKIDLYYRRCMELDARDAHTLYQYLPKAKEL
jgi:hypothetical protein